MPTLTLLVGKTFAQHSAEQDKCARAINSFFSRCDVRLHPHTSMAGWTCAAYGVPRQPDWPVGPILAQASQQQSKNMFWICADPVHLVVDRDSLVLQPRSQLQLSKADGLALFATLETHFAKIGMRMAHIDSGHWCLGVPDRPHLVTSDLECVEGRDVNDEMPSGQDSASWQRYVTEAQMILHDHQVNVARESRGEAVINSLWLWGGGVSPQPEKSFDSMSVNDAFLQEIGKLSGAQMIRCDAGEFSGIGSGNALAELPVSPGIDYGNALSKLEVNWIAPAWRALRTGKLDRFTVVLQLPGAVVECACDRKSRTRFWKIARPLTRSLSKFQDAL